MNEMDRQAKQAHFTEAPKRRFFPWVIAAVAVLLVGAGGLLLRTGDGRAGEVRAAGGRVSIPVATVGDGKAHFYTWRHNGVPIRFFVLKSHDGVIRTAFDSCDVCYKEKKGYRQDGDAMICNNCDMRFSSDRINEVKGGCNPAPIERSIAGGQVVLAEAALVQGAKYFQ